MQHKADQWLSQPNLNWRNCQGSIYWPFSKKDDAEETAQQLDIQQESCLFGKFKTDYWHSTRRLLIKKLQREVMDIQHVSCLLKELCVIQQENCCWRTCNNRLLTFSMKVAFEETVQPIAYWLSNKVASEVSIKTQLMGIQQESPFWVNYRKRAYWYSVRELLVN